MPTLHEAELYGSKLVAALDRQHPRDLFDVMHMYALFGLREDIVDAFVGYLAGHNRPIHEVLFGPKHSMAEVYETDFVGMTLETVGLDVLEATQGRLHRELPAALTENHRQFLLSLVRAEPDWSLMPYEHLRDLHSRNLCCASTLSNRTAGTRSPDRV
ncbi:nucleotidyl transferase AbiEii/AbiGii toxin family protein [Ralstonia pseudosolanacearum]|nr:MULTISPECIES: nucleotidyl transferase AbiEii/AbiGii toxin family protein [Ralstonia solanacearum species complex]